MAYYAFIEHGVLPSVIMNLPRKERILLMAMLTCRSEDLEKEAREMKSKAKR